MATAPSVLFQEPSRLKSKSHVLHLSPQSPPHPSLANFRIRTDFRNLAVKCYVANHSSKNSDSDQVVIIRNKTKKNSWVVECVVKALKKPAAVAVLVGLLLMYDPCCNWAVAASGGRMGGRAFSSSSRSRSYTSAPSRSSSSSSSSFPSWSYTPTRSNSRSFSVPFYESSSPFGGVFVGPALGIGSDAFLIMVTFVAFLVVAGAFSGGGSQTSVLTPTEKNSVLKLQVGLLGLGRSLQKDLNRIAETADTSTTDGLHYILTETVLALLRHPDYCISAYSSVDVKRSMEEVEQRFNKLSIEERGKFDEETLVNVNNIKKQSSTILRASGFSNEYIVITILVAARGEYKLPSISNSKDLNEALQMLASIPSSRTLAVEVLWTPQNEDDTLSERELLEDYPLLRPL